jgi:hypothetical protein
LCGHARNMRSAKRKHWVLPNEDPFFCIEPDGLLSYC